MSEYHQEYQQKLKEQNNLLDQLHNSVANTRSHAVTIGGELQQQDDMLDQLHSGIDRTTNSSRQQNRNVIQLLKESESRGFYSLVIVLVIILVFLLMV
ncbi:hypothetical protein, conserved [Angomonas deanei]|uniref:t-SNARE coiled-coil homology domain-containing protein n=1 Tax=Angomonas deanei TaxID=59799 RepID=A0A7G2CM60_9TRYP|nr:hypothetical protein, conserved [Angomonas deanei]